MVLHVCIVLWSNGWYVMSESTVNFISFVGYGPLNCLCSPDMIVSVVGMFVSMFIICSSMSSIV